MIRVREKTARHPGQGTDHESQGSGKTRARYLSWALNISTCAMSFPADWLCSTPRPVPRSPDRRLSARWV